MIRLITWILALIPEVALAQGKAPWVYDVTIIPGGRELKVVATFGTKSPGKIVVKPGAAPFVRDLEQATATGFVPLKKAQEKSPAQTQDSWLPGACPKGGCKVRYVFALADAAAALADFDMVAEQYGIFVSDPGAWLIHSMAPPEQQEARVHITAPPGTIFATGLFPTDAPNTYRTTADWLDSMPMTLIGSAQLHRFELKGGTIDVVIAKANYGVNEGAILSWAQRAASAVEKYFDDYPVPHSLLYIRPQGANGGGVSYGGGGAVSVIPLQLTAKEDDLRADWVMTHEMVHLAFPSVHGDHHWIEEGIATYVEPIARLRTKELKPGRVLQDMIVGLPQGLPEPGDEGLDHTHTWGRTYWGGALFCFLADVELRKRSGGKFGFEHALRGILAAGGDVSVEWELNRALVAADHATGIPVLKELYDKMKDKPYSVDLNALWKDLGVLRDAAGAFSGFDDSAPLAYVRKAIISGEPGR